jgi:predicted HTH domain antitoxin
VALELFRQGRISSGKAAELIGISMLDFMRVLGKHDIAYFTETPAELDTEVAAVSRFMNKL